jgi:hypothetical protein
MTRSQTIEIPLRVTSRLVGSADLALPLDFAPTKGFEGIAGGFTTAFRAGFGSTLTAATLVTTVDPVNDTDCFAHISGHFHCAIMSDNSSP